MASGEDILQKNRIAAVVLAAGQGTRMGGGIRKQYMDLLGKPLVCYALEAFERSSVDQVVLVSGVGEETYCKKEIVERYGYRKVKHIVAGGRERYHSVYEGLKVVDGCSHVLIHDGARPFVSRAMIESAVDGAMKYQACAVGVPVKDTIKIADGEEYALETPDRSRLWAIQTPQAFEYSLILGAYEKLFQQEEHQIGVTDDAMVVENMTGHPVKLIRGGYSNIKVTTPEDIVIARALLDIIEAPGKM